MTVASANTLLELHAACQFYLRQRSMKTSDERERLRRALRQLFKDRAAEIPPDLARNAGEAFAALREALDCCRKFGVAWDEVVAAVNRETCEERHG
jgi:hypothetical protein